MPDKLILLVSLWLKDENISGFEAFERQAAAIMAKHGGKIERVVRLNGGDPDAQAFATYRADPASAALAEMRQQVIARTLVWTGKEIDSYEAATLS